MSESKRFPTFFFAATLDNRIYRIHLVENDSSPEGRMFVITETNDDDMSIPALHESDWSTQSRGTLIASALDYIENTRDEEDGDGSY